MIIEKKLSSRKLQTLEANPVAAAAVRGYDVDAKWAPTNLDVVSVYIDLIGLPWNRLVDKDNDYTERYYDALNDAIGTPFDVLVQNIAKASVARAAERERARSVRKAAAVGTGAGGTFAGRSPSSSECVPSDYEYLR